MMKAVILYSVSSSLLFGQIHMLWRLAHMKVTLIDLTSNVNYGGISKLSFKKIFDYQV